VSPAALDHTATPQEDASLFRLEFETKPHRRLAGEGLLAFYNAIEQGGLILTPKDCKSGGVQYLVHYQKLARASVDQGQFERSVVNSHHFSITSVKRPDGKTQRIIGVIQEKISLAESLALDTLAAMEPELLQSQRHLFPSIV
jgi:hypothetical protein